MHAILGGKGTGGVGKGREDPLEGGGGGRERARKRERDRHGAKIGTGLEFRVLGFGGPPPLLLLLDIGRFRCFYRHTGILGKIVSLNTNK